MSQVIALKKHQPKKKPGSQAYYYTNEQKETVRRMFAEKADDEAIAKEVSKTRPGTTATAIQYLRTSLKLLRRTQPSRGGLRPDQVLVMGDSEPVSKQLSALLVKVKDRMGKEGIEFLRLSYEPEGVAVTIARRHTVTFNV